MPQGLSLLHTITYIFHLLPSPLPSSLPLPRLFDVSCRPVDLSATDPSPPPPLFLLPPLPSLSGPTVYLPYDSLPSRAWVSSRSPPTVPWLSMPRCLFHSRWSHPLSSIINAIESRNEFPVIEWKIGGTLSQLGNLCIVFAPPFSFAYLSPLLTSPPHLSPYPSFSLSTTLSIGGGAQWLNSSPLLHLISLLSWPPTFACPAANFLPFLHNSCRWDDSLLFFAPIDVLGRFETEIMALSTSHT